MNFTERQPNSAMREKKRTSREEYETIAARAVFLTAMGVNAVFTPIAADTVTNNLLDHYSPKAPASAIKEPYHIPIAEHVSQDPNHIAQSVHDMAHRYSGGSVDKVDDTHQQLPNESYTLVNVALNLDANKAVFAANGPYREYYNDDSVRWADPELQTAITSPDGSIAQKYSYSTGIAENPEDMYQSDGTEETNAVIKLPAKAPEHSEARLQLDTRAESQANIQKGTVAINGVLEYSTGSWHLKQ